MAATLKLYAYDIKTISACLEPNRGKRSLSVRGQIYATLNSKNGKISEAVWGHLEAVEADEMLQVIILSAVKFDSKSNFGKMASIKATWIFGLRSLPSIWEMTEAKLRLFRSKQRQ